MKKTKLPGDNFSLKTKKTEDVRIMEWINRQSNLMDSFRYLIELEIARNGIRNLQAVIPAERNILDGGDPSLPQETAAAAEFHPEPEPAPEEDFDEEDIASWI